MIRLIPILFAIVFCHHAVGGANIKIMPTELQQFYDLYKNLDRQNQPIFVSVDCIIHTFHLLYDYSLREIETDYLIPKLDTLLQVMIDRTKVLPDRYDEHTFRNLAYFSVARKLLNPDYQIENSVSNLAQQELDLIKQHEGFNESPIFKIDEDYSQFVPRGHYTRSETLKSYFQAATYLGRMGFYIKPRNKELSKPHVIRALLIMAILDKDAYRLWQEIYKVTNIYVGESDDLGPLDFKKLINDNFPNREPLDIINNDKELEKFIEYATVLRRPKIISTMTRDDEDVYLSSLSFKFMGQRFIPDSYIFQNLVYNKVGTRDNPRLFPKGLDVAGVLGSKRAIDILINHYHEDQYLNYEKQLKMLRDEFSNLPESQWKGNIYWGWLAIIKDLITPPKQGPKVFRTTTWIDKTLTTALAFWAELRHDAILYAKQSYTVAIASIREPKEKHAYLEPRIETFKRLKELATLFPDTYLSNEMRAKIENFRALIIKCVKISEQEIRGDRIAREDELYLCGIGSNLEYLSQLPANEVGMTDADKTIEMIADVHTDANSKRVLEVGIGKIDQIEITIDGKKYFGGIFSYYEFLRPMSERLTDEQWQKMAKPKRPEWQRGYLPF